MITMSRRKQSNPKPHKPGDEDACWGGNGENEKMPENLENGYDDKELLPSSSASPSRSPSADYHRKSVSPGPKAAETAPAVVQAESSSSPTGNCADSPAVSTGGLRINALLATDPAKRVSTATATVKLEPPPIPDDQAEVVAPAVAEQSVIKRIVNASSAAAGCGADTQAVNNADVKRQSPLAFVAIKNEHTPAVAVPANFSLQPDPVISSQSVFAASRILNCPGTSQSSLPAPPTVSCSVVELPRSKVDASTDTSKQGYLCSPCGIKFSSLSTLEAHQTYYCSHRPKKMSKGSTESESEDSRTFSGYDQEDSSGGETMAIESPVNKACKTGKQYRCTHCSYGADKKVSLNRHMRMHSVSPATNDSDSAGPTSQPQQSSSIDRYCQECDIRFSNLKTFRAHKMHYCSTRNVIKQAVVNSSRPLSPSTLPPTVADPMAASLIPPINIPNGVTGVSAQPPFLALPTNPILIVPYSLMQGASVLSTPLVSNVASQNAVYFLLPDGSLQLVTQSVQPLSHNISNIASVLQPTQPNQILQAREIPDAKNLKMYPNSLSVAGPLDLSLRKKSIDRESEMYEEDKENRHHEFDNTDDHEDIVCAPSIPLLLSTSSNSSTPSPSPLSPPAPKLDKNTSSPPAPKLSPNPPPMSKSPKRVFNGVIKNGCKKDYPDGSKVAPEFSPSNGDHRFIADVLFSAAAAAAAASKNPLGMDHPSRELPFPPDILSYLAAQTAAAAASASSSSSATRRSPATTTPLLLPTLPQSAPPSAQNLPFLTSEMVRLAAASNVACPTSPFIRQGMWKCEDCHIGFCKYENYLAHKKHYCSTRNVHDGSSGSSHPDDAQKTSPAGSPVMKPSSPAQQSTVAAKDGASPPVSNPIVVNQNNGTNVTTVVPNTGAGGTNAKQVFLHVVCNLCGIKFTSLDNLTTHQAFYCTKRNVIQETADKSSLKCCSKCKALLPMDELPIHQCGTVGNAPVNSGGWKCPCCFVTFATADAVQKHIQSHNGIKAFLCTICNYKGNTIRGMRSHIRVHFNKRNVEVMEENYITCVLEENSSSAVNEDATASSEKKSAPNNNKSSGDETVCNGDATRRQRVDSVATASGAEEDDDEYIDVGEISPSVKTETSTKSFTSTEDGSSVKEHRSERRSSPAENSITAEDSVTAAAVNNSGKGGDDGTSAKPVPLSNSNYCESCNISFNYLSTFIAHKKYYCTTKRVLLNVSSDVSSPPPLNSIEPISVPVVNVTSEAAIQII